MTKNNTKLTAIIDNFISDLKSSKKSIHVLYSQNQIIESLIMQYGTSKKNINKLANAMNKIKPYCV